MPETSRDQRGGTSPQDARDSFYRSRNLSHSSMESEALLDHRYVLVNDFTSHCGISLSSTNVRIENISLFVPDDPRMLRTHSKEETHTVQLTLIHLCLRVPANREAQSPAT